MASNEGALIFMNATDPFHPRFLPELLFWGSFFFRKNACSQCRACTNQESQIADMHTSSLLYLLFSDALVIYQSKTDSCINKRAFVYWTEELVYIMLTCLLLFKILNENSKSLGGTKKTRKTYITPKY